MPDLPHPDLDGLAPLPGADCLLVAPAEWPNALPGGASPEARVQPTEGVPAGPWTAVVVCDALTRIPDPSRLLDELVEATAPGGLLLLVEPTVGDAEALAARGSPEGWPPFRAWQLGSVVQGYGLKGLGFSPTSGAMRVWGERPRPT